MVAGESRDKVQREDLGRLKVPSTPRCSYRRQEYNPFQLAIRFLREPEHLARCSEARKHEVAEPCERAGAMAGEFL